MAVELKTSSFSCGLKTSTNDCVLIFATSNLYPCRYVVLEISNVTGIRGDLRYQRVIQASQLYSVNIQDCPVNCKSVLRPSTGVNKLPFLYLT